MAKEGLFPVPDDLPPPKAPRKLKGDFSAEAKALLDEFAQADRMHRSGQDSKELRSFRRKILCGLQSHGIGANEAKRLTSWERLSK